MIEKQVIIGSYLAIANLVAFVLFAFDKAQARSGSHRVPELTLLIMCLLGGLPGGVLGMYIFRHKTEKTYFKATLVLIAIVNISFIIWYLGLI